MKKVFNKILVARKSVSNDCHSESGAKIWVDLPDPIPKHGSWRFVDGSSFRNRFGWVVDSDSFTIDQFLIECGLYTTSEIVANRFREAQIDMLNTISRLKTGDAVAVDYMKRGIPPVPVLVVHRVLFWNE
jgi:hypothetical protein